ncbi:Uncharacterized protein PECH_000332 [Penicillium ucsense]|uniref:Small ribosomal subunit protein uS10m n=1 Tax=Penicillium ucsense TaxID=2839758 RepID=A0A8J8W131_9EURO|nr:Uncharacterized protein PECM_008801 [Penicillium ucsense]KAF7733675.1 Uncharacterized protein PECH_000332 [Penicillium ucsense]
MFSGTTRSLVGASKRLWTPISIRSLSTPNQPSAPSTKTSTTAPQIKAEPTPTSATSPTSAASTPVKESAAPEKAPVKEWLVEPWRSLTTLLTVLVLMILLQYSRSDRLADLEKNARLPRSVQALYLRPLRRKAEHGLPVCDLQLRSYSAENLEFFADFAIRAAYYLKLPVSGPVPLPRITQRWTVIRSNFVHKKSKENFERITLRRLIQIKDGHPEAVQAWLAFLRKHAFYGVGMKANVWEHESLDAGKALDASLPEIQKTVGPHLAQFGQREDNKRPGTIFDALDNARHAEPKNL